MFIVFTMVEPEDSVRQVSFAFRNLTEEEKEKLEKQNSRLVTDFQAMKLEENAKKHWDIFYKRNETRFFKDRHWTTREFKELLGESFDPDKRLNLLEVGCGVGNLVFPLIEENTGLYIYACDFSPRAVELVKKNPLYDSSKINAFQADITSTEIIKHISSASIDIVTIVFVLSAIHPDKFSLALKNLNTVLKTGGVVLVRDYGVFDMTQIRFKPGHKIQENMYMRQDGTRTYFFSIEKMREIFVDAGFVEISCNYVETQTVNLKESINVPRVFVQAKFTKKDDT